jgi:hypothetical protein
MNKSRIILIAAMIIGSVLLFTACTPGTSDSKASDSKAEVITGALNSTYLLGKESITLVNGIFEKKAAPNSSAVNKTQVWEQPIIGDLNADGKDDAAVCLINTPGGSGTFYYIAAAINDANMKNFKGTNAVFLGDRIQLSKLSIENNIISVTYNEIQAGKAMTATPSVTVSKKFKVENGLLKEITGEVDGNSNSNNSNNSNNNSNSNSNTNTNTNTKDSYTLIRTAYKSNNSIIYFPQLSGVKGELLMGYMNQSLKKVADKYAAGRGYTNVVMDYVVTRQDDVLSVLFKGTGEMQNIGSIQIMESVNLDIGKSTNEIKYDNLIQNTDEARLFLQNKLNQAAERKGIKGGFNADGVRIYFTSTDIVFFYMPPDDTAKKFIELSIPRTEIEPYLNHDFGSRPAS